MSLVEPVRAGGIHVAPDGAWTVAGARFYTHVAPMELLWLPRGYPLCFCDQAAHMFAK